MRYYVAADPHGFCTELKTALEEQGFFADSQPHKLILCGDCFDRGHEAVQMQEFLLELLDREEVILIRGNHEDLMLRLLNQWHTRSYLQSHHISNGTVDTVCQLTGFTLRQLLDDPEPVGRALLHTPLVQKIIPAAVDYFETEHYIFVHGWLPGVATMPEPQKKAYKLHPRWRKAKWADWEDARWVNGMEAAHLGAIEPGKTVVCGHWHCSFGHARYEGKGGEFDNQPDFSPYYAEGIIALDTCTAYTQRVNCIVLEDESLV